MAVAALASAQININININSNPVFAEAEPIKEPCCNTCDDPAMEKYYSVDHIFHMCGECCMDPSNYWLFKLFEPGLTKHGDSNTPCSDLEYTSYVKTDTHGAGPITMTLDMYKKEKTEE